jgi:hypothetical protein
MPHFSRIFKILEHLSKLCLAHGVFLKGGLKISKNCTKVRLHAEPHDQSKLVLLVHSCHVLVMLHKKCSTA